MQDFELTSVYVSVPLYLAAALIATVVYSIWYVSTAIRHHRRIDTWFWQRSAAPALLAVLPLLTNIPVVWFGFERVARGMSLFGGGRAALSAGVAEALVPLCLGATMSGVLAAFATVVIPLRPHGNRGSQQSQEKVAPRSITLPLVFGSAAGASVLATCHFAVHLFETRSFAPAQEQQARLGCVVSALVAAAAISCVMSTQAKNKIDSRGGAQTISLCIIIVVSILAGVGVWRAIGFYSRVALGVITAAQLFAAADSRPFAGPALPRLVLRDASHRAAGP